MTRSNTLPLCVKFETVNIVIRGKALPLAPQTNLLSEMSLNLQITKSLDGKCWNSEWSREVHCKQDSN